MSYFDPFPTIAYDPTGDKNYKTIKDILLRVKMKDAIKSRYAIFEKYDIKDGETPEKVAYENYGDPNLYWIILMTNEILNPFYDWPLSIRDFERYIADKYDSPYDTHHYEIAQSSGTTTKMVTVPSTTPLAEAISYYDYESNLHNDKKQIKLLKAEYVLQIVNEFKKDIQR